MPQPFKEKPADKFDPATDLVEMIGDSGPATLDATNGRLEASVPYRVPFNKERGALRWLLGYTSADSASPWALRREQPAKHPRYPQLRAFAANSTPIVPKSNSANTSKSTSRTSQFDDSLLYADYEYTQIVVRYCSFGRMGFYSDIEMAEGNYQEYWRNITVDTDPQVETVNSDGYQLKFIEGSPSGTPFPCQMPELYPKANVKIKWWFVPHSYVSDHPFFLQPTKIMNLLGCVNSAPFFKYPSPSTDGAWPTYSMLLLSATFEEALWPVAPADVNQPLTGYHITFELLHAPRVSAVVASTYRGHRVFPWRTDGKFYGAARETGQPFLKEADINAVFDHVKA